MILLDKPIVSDLVLNTIREGHIMGLDTGNVVPLPEPSLLHEGEALHIISKTSGINLHTTSENALRWIYDKLPASGLPEKINLFKNKLAFRDLIKDMYPGFFYLRANSAKLDDIDIAGFPMPFIIKPAVGFFSMSVHKVFDAENWKTVKARISAEQEDVRKVYPAEVLKLDEYIIEECIDGREYAFDAYFDDQGKAVLMGAMHHPFSGDHDVSDRVYNTSRDIVRENKIKFEGFLKELEKRTHLRNFSLHVEVRIDNNGNLVPIEVNPLRFGAWCTSADLTHYAFKFNPYACYIRKMEPEWDNILEKAGDSIYSIIILENSTGIKGENILSFDYDKVLSELGKIELLELRKINYHEYPIFGILFTRARPEDYGNIENMLHADMRMFIKSN